MKKILAAVTLAVTVVAGIVLADVMLNPARAAECSASHVAKCGVWSVDEMRGAYNGDTTPGLKNIFHGMGITGDMVNHSTVKEGTVGKDGNVVVDGKTVATNAVSAGRTVMSHTKERTKHEHGGTDYYSSPTYDSFRSSKLDAYVFFDTDGRFQGAVIKECGNPVHGKPTQPEKPKDEDIQVCELATKKYPVTIKKSEFDESKHSMKAEDCKEEEPKTIEVCELKTKKYPVTINEDEFSDLRHSMDPNDCKEEPKTEEPKKIKVCELDTKKYPVWIKEDEFDESKHSMKAEDCKEEEPKTIEVCELKTKKYPVTINEDEFSDLRHSMDPNDCKEEEKPEKIKVCQLKGKKYPVWIYEGQFDKKKYSKNADDCKEEEPETMEVCELKTKKHPVTINKEDFDESLHSEDAADCKEEEQPKPEEKPPVAELPQTGVASGIVSTLGIGSLVTAGAAYMASRRNL